MVKTVPSNAGGAGWIIDGEYRIPHASWPKKPQQKKKNYNKFNQDFKNSSHIKILKKGKSWVLTKLDLPFYCCLVTKLCSTPVQPCGLSMPGSSVHSQVGILEWVAISCSRDLSNPEIKPASPDSPILQADSYCFSEIGRAHV